MEFVLKSKLMISIVYSMYSCISAVCTVYQLKVNLSVDVASCFATVSISLTV